MTALERYHSPRGGALPERDAEALAPFIESRLRTPFAWGARANDCAGFAANGVRAVTGRDLIRELGVSWTTALGAARVLKRLGGLDGACDRVMPRTPPAMARRGDVALVDGAEGPTLALVEGETLAAPGASGVVRFPRAAARLCWSIDREAR